MKYKTMIVVASLAVVAGNHVLAAGGVSANTELNKGKEAIVEAVAEQVEATAIEVVLERGAEVFDLCSGCHGDQAEGSEDLGAPKLAGQHGWYLSRQLNNFRAEIRGAHDDDEYGSIMQPMVADLEDQEIKDVVVYIGTLDANFVPEDD